MEIHLKIGSKEDNDIVFAHPSVSRSHLEVRYRGGNEVHVLDKSTNGTFINDRRIKSSTLKLSDRFRLGELVVNTADFFQQLREHYNKDKSDYSEEFKKLEPEFKSFERQQRKIRSKSSLVPTVVRSGITLLIIVGVMFLNIDDSWRYPLIIGATVFGGIAVSLIPGNNTNEKLQLLRARYESKLRCPSCETNLTGRYLSVWKQQGKCSNCGALWVKKGQK